MGKTRTTDGTDGPDPNENDSPESESERTTNGPGSADPRVDVYLMELEQMRIDIRTTLRRKGLIITSAVSAEGLAIVYSVVGESPASILGVSVVPVIIGLTAILIIREDTRQARYERHARELENALKDDNDMNLGTFGWHQRVRDERQQLVPFHKLVSFITGGVYIILSGGIILFLSGMVDFPASGNFGMKIWGPLSVIYVILFVAMVSSYHNQPIE